MNENNIKEKIEKAWSKDTSYWPDKWDEKNPASGQCAITALAIQEELGGEIMRCEVEGFGSHYYNILADGSKIDLTERQFPANVIMKNHSTSSPAELLKSENTRKRFLRLKDRFI